MKEVTKRAIKIAIIAGILVFCDSLITKLLNLDSSFAWVAFVSWPIFANATEKERLKAISGFVIGFFAAISMIYIANLLSFTNIFGISIGAIIATMIINFIVFELDLLKKYFTISISGLFFGISMVFSGLGIGLTTDNFKSSFLMLVLIIIYGIIGLLCGWANGKYVSK